MGLAGALTSWACLGIGLALGWWIRDRAAHHGPGPHQPPDPAATGPPAPPGPTPGEPGRHGLLTAEMQALPPPLDPSAAYRTRPSASPLPPRPLPPEHPQTHAADHFGTRASDPPTALQPLPPPLPGGRRRSDQPRQTRRQARAVREGPPDPPQARPPDPDDPTQTELTDNPP